MRQVIVLGAFLCSAHSGAQWAIDMAAAGSDDRIADRTLMLGVASAEFRLRALPAFACRASLSFSPWRTEMEELWGHVEDPEPRTWLLSRSERGLSMMGAAFDLKLPFSDTTCIGGLYRGFYTTFGLGFNHYTRSLRARTEDKFGNVHAWNEDTEASALLVRGGFGGEWNMRWGCPFAEVQLGLGGGDLFSTYTALVGFRYVFVPKGQKPLDVN